MRLSAGALALTLSAVSAHPARHSNVKDVDCSGPPAILSYHVHIVYGSNNDVQVAEALDLLAAAETQFAPYLGSDCDIGYDNARLCLITDHNINGQSYGPWPSGEWAFFVPVPYYQLVVPWMTQHHGNLSLLVHPNTGCENEDHSIWALWAGKPWPLNMEIFTPLTQTNEFNETRGDSDNPVCMADQQICGTPDVGPQLVCCAGLTCSCPPTGNATCMCT